MFKTTIASCALRLPSVFCYLSSVLCCLFSTLVVRALQIHPFLTNKANFQKSQINLTYLLKRNYEQMDTWSIRKNKAKTKPIQTQFKANSKPIQTQFKPNLSRRSLWRRRNKPNSDPQTQSWPNQFNWSSFVRIGLEALKIVPWRVPFGK